MMFKRGWQRSMDSFAIRVGRLPLRYLSSCILLALACGDIGIRRERPARFDAPRGILAFVWARPLTDHSGAIDTWHPEELAVAEIDTEKGLVFVGSAAGVFYCLRARDGAVVWSLRTDGAVSSRGLLVRRSGVIYFGSDDGNLYAVRAHDGHLLWRYTCKGTIRQPPIYDAGVVYFTTSEGRVYAVEARTGRWRWHYERPPSEGFTVEGQSGVSLARGRIYAGFSDGTVVALDVRTGDLLWLRSLAGKDTGYVDADGTPFYDSDRDALYVTAYESGVHALDPEDGNVRWRLQVRAATAPRRVGGEIYVASAEEGVVAIDLDGRRLWRQNLRNGVPSAPVGWGDYLFITASDRGLYAVDRHNGQLLTNFPPGGGISAEPAVGDGQLFVLSNYGTLYAARLSSGR